METSVPLHQKSRNSEGYRKFPSRFVYGIPLNFAEVWTLLIVRNIRMGKKEFRVAEFRKHPIYLFHFSLFISANLSFCLHVYPHGFLSV